MTSDLCADDVVVHISTPQIISAEGGGAGGGGAGGARVAAAVELGRRLLVAARGGDTAAVLELMAAGAPFTADWLGTSALHLAAAHAHADTCAVLLRAGVSRDARTKVERTPLHLAAGAGHARVVRLLLAAGAAPEPRDMLRMTPLHWAAARGHAAAAAALLAAGADPLARSKFRKSPLSLARARGDAALLQLLEDAVRAREAKRSVHDLVADQTTDETAADQRLFETVQRIEEASPPTPAPKVTPQRPQPEKVLKADKTKNERAAALLRQHGITLLPADDTSTVLSALQSGRTVVLSDAGKLMLKESAESPAATKAPILVKLPSASKGHASHPSAGEGSSAPRSGLADKSGGVVLTATPVSSPPRGVKVFTVNNKLRPARPQQQLQQVKIVQLPQAGKLMSPSRLVPLKAKPRAAPMRIVMNRADLQRLVEPAGEGGAGEGGGGEGAGAGAGAARGEEGAALRAQLAQAQRTVSELRGQLQAARAQLARLEAQGT